MPILRITSATGVPLSACRSAKAICSSVNRFLFMAPTLLRVQMPEKVVLEMDQFTGSGPRKEVESVEPVMIRYGHLIWSEVPYVEAGAPEDSGSAWTAL